MTPLLSAQWLNMALLTRARSNNLNRAVKMNFYTPNVRLNNRVAVLKSYTHDLNLLKYMLQMLHMQLRPPLTSVPIIHVQEHVLSRPYTCYSGVLLLDRVLPQ